MRHILFILAAILFFFTCSVAQESGWEGKSVDLSHGQLRVTENNRYLEFEDGTPFFYMGGTAWELFHRLNKPETERYLENRREKGFTVIQAVILAELDGLNTPNAEGETPLIDNNPLKPNEAYFEHVDWVIKKAAEKGMFIGLLPTWGDKVSKRWGVGPEIFNEDNAYEYGRWLGKRYQSFPNIIWIIGGDRLGGGDNFPVWDAMAKGIKSVDQNHLMTYHPMGGRTSAEWFHDCDWLDFNMLQSSHGRRFIPNYRQIRSDYSLYPVKPCMDGEPNYEDIPISFDPANGWFNERDVRHASWWSVFAGGMGITYGCNNIWQMYDTDKEPVIYARKTWDESLDLPGAWDMLHLRKLMESRPFTTGKPFPSMILSDAGGPTNKILATKGDGYAFIYLTANSSVKVELRRLEAEKVKAWWYNPRKGDYQSIGSYGGESTQRFEVPGRGVDWVLVLDRVSDDFPPPGQL